MRAMRPGYNREETQAFLTTLYIQ